MSNNTLPSGPTRRSRFWRAFLRWANLNNPHRDLSSILEQASPTAPLEDRILWLAELVAWIRGPSLKLTSREQRIARVRFVMQLLGRHPEWEQNVGFIIRTLVMETEAPAVFAQTELDEQSGLGMEIFRRIGDRMLPARPRPHELGYVFEVVFSSDEDIEWLEGLSESDWRNITDLTGLSGCMIQSLRLETDLRDAVLALSVQAAALGLSPGVRLRTRRGSDATQPSAFVNLNRAVVLWREGDSPQRLYEALDECEQIVRLAFEAVESSGISLILVYRLETISAHLRRIRLILNVLDSPIEKKSQEVRKLLIEVVRTHRARRSIRELLNLRFDIFARKLVEHAGESGEHYITRTRAEYLSMFKAGAGGGVITVFTTLIKFLISALWLAPFFEVLFIFLNYAGSFIAMQFMGFALATKQPSMTAAALAGRLSQTLNRHQLSEFVEEVARITRTQFIAAVGNVGLVIPGAFLANMIYFSIFGKPVLSPEYAVKTLEHFHPWKSLSVWYAALTGVLLWLSSFGAGWLENWVLYRGLREAIIHHRRLRGFLGDHRTQRLGEWLSHNASGLGGNLAIGFLLAVFPVFGTFLGLPLDIRHITLTAGSMTFAFCALDASLVTPRSLAVAATGLFLIGVMNFAVATTCALIVAVRARKVRKVWFVALLVAVRKTFLKNPVRFFFPPREAAGTERTKPH